MSYAEVMQKDPDISYVAILNKDRTPLATVSKKDSLSPDQLVDTAVMAEDLELATVIIGFNYDKLNRYLAEA